MMLMAAFVNQKEKIIRNPNILKDQKKKPWYDKQNFNVSIISILKISHYDTSGMFQYILQRWSTYSALGHAGCRLHNTIV